MYATVTVTCAGWDEGRRIADLLVAGRLAACVHLSAVESRYSWQGEDVTDDEVVLTAQTRRDRFDDLARAVTAAHSYDLPAITMTELAGGTDAYLAWIGDRVDGA